MTGGKTKNQWPDLVTEENQRGLSGPSRGGTEALKVYRGKLRLW